VKYSVVITTRNRRELLSETIASVLGSVEKELELIVVDDASTDGTREYLTTIRDSRLVIENLDPHRERSFARNAGLRLARGEYIMFLDDDDLLRPDALPVLAHLLDQHDDVVMAVGGMRFLERNGDSTLRHMVDREVILELWELLMLGWWSNSGQNLYRVSVLEKVGGFSEEYTPCEDREFLLRVNRQGRAALTPKVVMHYRIHGGQSKPANLKELRDRVYAEQLEGLDSGQKREAIRLRQAGTQLEEGGRMALLRAIVSWPRMMVHPALRRQVWWAMRNGQMNF